MAREIGKDYGYDLSADMFSIGVLIYYIFVRWWEFNRRDFDWYIINEIPINIPDVGSEINDIVNNLFQQNPLRRMTIEDLYLKTKYWDFDQLDEVPQVKTLD